MIKQATLTALAAAGLTLGTAAHAALFVAPIDNGSFENGSNPFGSAGNNAEVTDWFEESDDGGNSSEGDTAEVGQIKTANTGNIPQDAVGSYWLNLAGKSTVSNPAVYQQIGTWESNLQVNVTALLGTAATAASPAWPSSFGAAGPSAARPTARRSPPSARPSSRPPACSNPSPKAPPR